MGEAILFAVATTFILALLAAVATWLGERALNKRGTPEPASPTPPVAPLQADAADDAQLAAKVRQAVAMAVGRGLSEVTLRIREEPENAPEWQPGPLNAISGVARQEQATEPVGDVRFFNHLPTCGASDQAVRLATLQEVAMWLGKTRH